MDFVLKAVVLGRAARNTANIKNRQPLSLMYIKSDITLAAEYESIITEELNLKAVEFKNDVEGFVSYKFKPQLKTLGPRCGKLLPKINEMLQTGNGNEFMKSLKETGEINLIVDGNEVILGNDDVIIETAQAEGFVTEADGVTTVVLCTSLTKELIEEGFVRELISKIQTMRKEAGFDVLDRIKVYYGKNEVIEGIFTRNCDEIKKEVLSDSIEAGSAGYSKEWNINGENVMLSVERN
ncbi:soleucyl-trna synthetase [Holotrichia oblita]|nr:soleucyl-trna synthetase [Holotrichia oblita]